MYDFLSDSTEYNDNRTKPTSQIREHFRGKTVLLTGGTGFLGQLYIEKLIRSNVKEIYIFGREKKGISPEERFDKFFAEAHFHKMKEHDPNFMKKMRIINGDLTKNFCGISDSDLNDIYENVNIIIHSAADVRFDEKLFELVLANLRGTRELLRIAERIKNFELFTYISTAYSNCHRNNIEEKFYEPSVDPHTMIQLCENLKDSQLDEFLFLTQIIIRPWPNSYAFTKCLAEHICKQFGSRLPIIVVRPSIVISTHEDPVPGWCNNYYGLNGLFVACGMGVLRIIPFDRKLVGDIICADHVTHSTLAAIWYSSTEEAKSNKQNKITNGHENHVDPDIFYVGTGVDKPLKWKEIVEDAALAYSQNPAKDIVWKNCQNNTTCPFLFFYYSILFHLIPGVLCDTALQIFTSNEFRFIPTYRRLQVLMLALRFFMQKEIKFTNTNMRSALNAMSPEDKELYPCDTSYFDYKTFSYNYILGLRKYIIKEDPLQHNTLQKYKVFEKLHYIVLILFYGLHFAIFYLFANRINLFGYLSDKSNELYDFLLGTR